MSEQNNTKLKRNLTMFEGTMYAISYVIGTGIFLKPATVLANTGSTGMALVFWIVGGLISLASALSIAEIASYIPKLGGMYTYISELWGEKVGFLYGWMSFLITEPAGAAASAIAFATFASYFIELDLWGLRALAIAVILFFAIIQWFSTKGAMRIQVIGTFAKLIPIFAIVIVGLFKGGIPGQINFALVGGNTKLAYGAALLGVLWSYDGWVATCLLGEEIVEPERNLPRAIITALIFVTIVYALFNVVVFKILPTNVIVDSVGQSVGLHASEVLFGNAGATLISLGMIVSSVVTLNAQIMSATRIILSGGKRRHVFGAEFLSQINPKTQTPTHALIVAVILILAYIMTGTFDSVTNLTIFTGWIFFVITLVGLFKKRKTYKYNPDLYNCPGFPIVPLIGIFGGLFLLTMTFIDDPRTALTSVAFMFLGLPMYFYVRKKYPNGGEEF